MRTTYPRDHELSSQVLHLGLDLAADVKLMAVEGDALQVGQQVLLASGVRTLEKRGRGGEGEEEEERGGTVKA